MYSRPSDCDQPRRLVCRCEFLLLSRWSRAPHRAGPPSSPPFPSRRTPLGCRWLPVTNSWMLCGETPFVSCSPRESGHMLFLAYGTSIGLHGARWCRSIYDSNLAACPPRPCLGLFLLSLPSPLFTETEAWREGL